MKQYDVTGMTCAACSQRVEKAVLKVNGVKSCSVSLLTNSMGVEGDVDSSLIIKAVVDAGYGASEKTAEKIHAVGKTGEEVPGDTETKKLVKRLVTSLVLLAVLMYFSMGHMMWNWPLPKFMEGNHVAMGLVQLLLSAAIMVVNQRFFISGTKSLLHGSPNMDTLVAMGAGVSFLYSTVALFLMTDAQVRGGSEAAMPYMHEFYFEAAGTILTLITVGKMLEARAKGKTTDALKSLIRLTPKEAVILVGDEEKRIPAEQVKIGDIFVVRPGESIPVDGVVVKGNSAVNEAALTGESIPVDKGEGDSVYSATINQNGFMTCKATKVGEDTTLSKIIQLVSDAAATKAPIAKIADRVSGVFVPVVIGIALITFILWMITGHAIGYSLARGIAVLVISCPCSLGLATPVAIMVGNGMGAKNGILYKTAVAQEMLGRVEIVALDKTGTITKGEPVVTDIIPLAQFTENAILEAAYAIEAKSEHPLAKAIVAKAKESQLDLFEVTEFEAFVGNGLKGKMINNIVYGGNERFISQYVTVTKEEKEKAKALANEGKTPIFFAMDNRLAGIIAVADRVKEDSQKAILEMKAQGLYVVMLTGDNERTAKAIAEEVAVDEVVAGILPSGKKAIVEQLKEKGKVLMVGDGINDAPALMAADTSIAIGAGTDVAMDAADIVLVHSKLSDVTAAIRLSRATIRNIHENLFWAFFYNAIGIPLAAGLFIPLFGWELNPMFGAAAMSLSSFCVVSNALRLNLFDLHNAKKDKKLKRMIQGPILDVENKEEKVEESMTKTLKIEGMMCGHCEAHVKKALEAIDGVVSATASHVEKSAVVTLDKEVSNEVLKEAVEAQDYKVLSVE